MASLWDKYDSDNTTYDEYLGEDNKLRKQAKVISSILEKIGSKKLQEIEKTAQAQSAQGELIFVFILLEKKLKKKSGHLI